MLKKSKEKYKHNEILFNSSINDDDESFSIQSKYTSLLAMDFLTLSPIQKRYSLVP